MLLERVEGHEANNSVTTVALVLWLGCTTHFTGLKSLNQAVADKAAKY